MERALERALEEQAAVFLRAKSPYLRERAEDLRNIKQMLVRKLSGSTLELSMPQGEGPVIVAAENLSPADTMALDKKRLSGFVTRYGGMTSHVVILAKNLGIPAVTGLAELGEVPDGACLLIDGVVTVWGCIGRNSCLWSERPPPAWKSRPRPIRRYLTPWRAGI